MIMDFAYISGIFLGWGLATGVVYALTIACLYDFYQIETVNLSKGPRFVPINGRILIFLLVPFVGVASLLVGWAILFIKYIFWLAVNPFDVFLWTILFFYIGSIVFIIRGYSNRFEEYRRVRDSQIEQASLLSSKEDNVITAGTNAL
jgi:hypothetical protein